MPTQSPVPQHGNYDQSKSNTSQFPCKHQGTSTRRALGRDSRTKLKHSAGDMIRPRTSMICCSSTVKRSGATVEDVTPGIHMEAQYGHSDRGWAGPTTPDGIHSDYMPRKTS